MFVAFGSTVLVPLLVGFDPAIALLAAGLGTLLFHGMSFIIPLPQQWGLPGTIAGLTSVSLVYFIMSALVKWQGKKLLDRIFPPVVIGPAIILIGLSLAGTGVDMASKNWILALVSLFVAIICSCWGKGMIKLIPVVFGALAGYIVAVIFYRSSMDFSGVANAPWFQLPHFSKMSLSWQAIVFMAPVAIVPIIEHVGDVYAISEIAGKDFVKDPGLHRTMLGDGLACTLAAFLGGAPVTTYSEVTGAVSLTKVTDPACMRIAALSAILISLVGKVGAAIQTIPTAVLGGIMLLLFGSIASVGISNLVKAQIDMNKTRNLIIASLILTIGIGGAVISFGKFSLAGIGLASVVGVILNLIIPDKKESEEANA